MIKKICLILCLLCYGPFVLADLSPKSDVQALTDKFQHLLILKETAFKNLTFSLSEKKIKRSVTYKLFLKDQYGREWMFKDTSADGSLAVFKLSLLLGMPSPEIHHFELSINDHLVKGSLQLFLPETRPFKGDYSELPDQSLNYFLYSHLLSWLSLNHHVHADQFILDQTNQIYRIDNSVSFTLLGFDSLDVSYVSPLLNHVRFPGYVEFWNYVFRNSPSFNRVKKDFNHVKNEQIRPLHLDFKGALLRSLLIQNLQDDQYIAFFKECMNGAFKNCGNNSFGSHLALFPYGYLHFNPSHFKPLMLARKNHIYPDLLNFYKELEKVYGGSLNLVLKKSEMADFIKKTSDRLDEEIKKLDKSNSVLAPVQKLNIKTEEDYLSFKDLQNLTVLNSITDQKGALRVLNEVKGLLSKERAARFSSNQVALLNIKFLESLIIKNGYNRQLVWSVVSNPAKFFEKDYVKNTLPNI